MADYTYATLLVSNQTLAQQHFGAYFNCGLSATGAAPATHWVTSGPFSNAELEYLANGQPWVAKIGFGQDPWTVINAAGLKPVAADPTVEPSPIEPTLDGSKATRIAQINAEAQLRITQRWPLWSQSNVALGVYSEPEATACRDWIAANIEASNTASDAINAATTVSEVNAVVVNWPV